jgi:hypothetical protein
MVRAQVLWEAHVRRFQDALESYKKRRLTAEQAGELFGLSGRHFRRQCVDFDAECAAVHRDKRAGRTSNRLPESERDRIGRQYRKGYPDFTVKHFHEELCRDHYYAPGSEVTRLGCNHRATFGPWPAAANTVTIVRAVSALG